MIEPCCEELSVRCILLYVLIMSSTSLRVNPHCIVASKSKNFLLEAGTKCAVYVTSTGLEPPTT